MLKISNVIPFRPQLLKQTLPHYHPLKMESTPETTTVEDKSNTELTTTEDKPTNAQSTQPATDSDIFTCKKHQHGDHCLNSDYHREG